MRWYEFFLCCAAAFLLGLLCCCRSSQAVQQLSAARRFTLADSISASIAVEEWSIIPAVPGSLMVAAAGSVPVDLHTIPTPIATTLPRVVLRHVQFTASQVARHDSTIVQEASSVKEVKRKQKGLAVSLIEIFLCLVVIGFVVRFSFRFRSGQP